MNEVAFCITTGLFQSLTSYVTFFGADKLIESFSNDCNICKVIIDNTSHSILSGLVWISVLLFEKIISSGSSIDLLLIKNCNIRQRLYNNMINNKFQFIEIFISMIMGSLLDLDHFITGFFSTGSFSLFAATHLNSRPFGHTAIFSIFFPTFLYLINGKYRLSLLLFSSILCHLLRDSVRRGIWLWPFGSTYPLPLSLVIVIYSLLSFLIAFILSSSCDIIACNKKNENNINIV